MSERLLVGTRKGLFTLQSHGKEWRVAQVDFLGDPVTIALTDPRDGTSYAALNLGHFGVKMHRRKAGAETWEECAAPAYPPQPEGQEQKDATFGQVIPWKTKMIWALEPGGPQQPGLLWCGTIPGGLFRSADGGTSWELVRSLWDEPRRLKWFGGGADLPGIHSICVDPRHADHVRLGVSCGGVWETLDGGKSWDCRATGMWAAYMPPEQKDDPNIQDPHRMVQCPQHPDAFWVQHHNGIFRSVDNCRSWQEVKGVQPSNFGFGVVVHPHDPQRAWFVPAMSDERRIPVQGQVVVTRTQDGGGSFDILRNGLPQEHAYDLIFRHALDIDRTGDQLAFGSTTGSLWLSRNQGDAWQCLSTHLPPVYCVRFAA